VPNETIVASEGLEAYLDELFDSLTVKNDISVIKQEIFVFIADMIQKHSDKIAALESIIIIFEASNAMLEIHTANLEQAKKIVSSTSQIMLEDRWRWSP